VASGRLFENFQLHATGGEPEAVREAFVAVTDPNWTCVGAKERSCYEESGSVFRSLIGYGTARGCQGTARAVDLGGSGQKIRARDGRWGECGPNDLGVGAI